MKIARYLIGLLGGATLGMLFAPKKGKELRKEIAKMTKEGEHSESFRTLAEAFKGAGKEMIKEAKDLMNSEQVQEFMTYGQDRMQKIIDSAEDRGVEFASMAQGKLEELATLASKKAKELEAMSHEKMAGMKDYLGKETAGKPWLKEEADLAKKKIKRTIKKTISKVKK